jgi:transcription antitermination factor NusG
LDCSVIEIPTEVQPVTPERGWFVLWSPTGFGGTSVRWVEVECALKTVDEEGRVWYPLYAEKVHGRTVMCAFYPSYMFIYCQWGNSVENVVRASVPITTLFLKDADAQIPHRLTDDEMSIVREQVETHLNDMGMQESPLGFHVGHTVRITHGMYIGQVGPVVGFERGQVQVELYMFQRDVSIAFDAKDLQIL